MREIADQLGLSKSKVGRVVKRLSASEGSLGNIAFVGPRGSGDEARILVLDAWGFSDLDATATDHPRGTHETVSGMGPTNFGGLNG